MRNQKMLCLQRCQSRKIDPRFRGDDYSCWFLYDRCEPVVGHAARFTRHCRVTAHVHLHRMPTRKPNAPCAVPAMQGVRQHDARAQFHSEMRAGRTGASQSDGRFRIDHKRFSCLGVWSVFLSRYLCAPMLVAKVFADIQYASNDVVLGWTFPGIDGHGMVFAEPPLYSLAKTPVSCHHRTGPRRTREHRDLDRHFSF